ncbi:hypothetical protein [Leptospira stimsonii]|uniref:Uncharacterized protein n=1 Tax=Leptospira stimsonii TaxID=2202203 RepID=A0A8B3CI39_9LEPT|nr:hypothetical protein [Leptospira stimsonii]RHX83286.1 hypothetical protein DLM78_22555 [Leptospira stimsonii]
MRPLILNISNQFFCFMILITVTNCSHGNRNGDIEPLILLLGNFSGSGPFSQVPDFPCEGNISKTTAKTVFFETGKERSGKGCRRYYKYSKDMASIGVLHQFRNLIQNAEFLKYYIAYENLDISDQLSDNEKNTYEQSSNFIYVKKDYLGESIYFNPGSNIIFILEALSAHVEYNVTFDGGDIGSFCSEGVVIDNNTPAKAFILTKGATVPGNVTGNSSPCFYEIRTNVAIPNLTVTATGAANLSLSVYAEKDTSLVEYSILNANATKTLSNIPVSINSRRLIKVDGLNAGSCPGGCSFNLSVQ